MTITPVDAWKESTASITNVAGARNAISYINVIKQFDVVNNPRYTPSKMGFGETYCNIFLWDVTKALNCEIPHWVDPFGNQVAMGKGKELNANGVFDWLAGKGFADLGWMVVSDKTAISRASFGFPTVVVWKNPTGIGHVAMVMPSGGTVRISQAGGSNLYDADLSAGFGHIQPLKYLTHE